jgi:DNA excision repair protein ERCC-2
MKIGKMIEITCSTWVIDSEEMPSGTGKTESLLSLVVAYMKRWPIRLKRLVYCSRTIPEIEKCVEEMKNLFRYYMKESKWSK